MFCLRAVGDQKYHDKHPFHIRMHQGELKADELRGWILNRFYYQKNIPVKDALVLSKLPTREDRRKWLQRIIDHDGREGTLYLTANTRRDGCRQQPDASRQSHH